MVCTGFREHLKCWRRADELKNGEDDDNIQLGFLYDKVHLLLANQLKDVMAKCCTGTNGFKKIVIAITYYTLYFEISIYYGNPSKINIFSFL